MQVISKPYVSLFKIILPVIILSTSKSHIANSENDNIKKVNLLINQFLLTKEDIETIQSIYRTEKKIDITMEEITTLVKIYSYICYFLSTGEAREILTEQPPQEILDKFKKNISLSNTLILLWNKDILYKVVGDMAASSEVNLQKKQNSDFFWQYMIISGNYTNIVPNKKHFKVLMESNFSPEEKLKFLEKKYGLKNVKVTFNGFQEWDRKDFIDKKNKTFSVIVHKSKMYTNIRYELIIYEYSEVQQAVDGFEIIQKNSAVLPEQIPNLMKYKNLHCRMTRTSIYAQEIDGGFAIILNNLPINQYSLVDNSYYVLYITNKSYCEENQVTKEERKNLLTKKYVDNIVKRLDNSSLEEVFKKLDHLLYA